MAIVNRPRTAQEIAPVGTYLENGKALLQVIDADAGYVWAENCATGYPMRIYTADLRQWRIVPHRSTE